MCGGGSDVYVCCACCLAILNVKEQNSLNDSKGVCYSQAHTQKICLNSKEQIPAAALYHYIANLFMGEQEFLLLICVNTGYELGLHYERK